MKRHNTKEQTDLITAWQSSGESIEAFCRRQKLSVSSFMRWKRKVPAETGTREQFLPVIISARRNDEAAGQRCRIRVGEYITIDCDEQSDPRSIERALSAAVRVCGLISEA